MSRNSLISSPTFFLALLGACAFTSTAFAADEKTKEWVQIATFSNAVGKRTFDLPANARVRVTWDTERDGQVPTFRAVLSKAKDRNGKITYQTLQTFVNTQATTKGNAIVALEKGGYQLYFATKMMKYTFTVEYEKRE
ncbi:MAG: hypothetical protein WD768_04550 [Phycisphaeraceae bacterium]